MIRDIHGVLAGTTLHIPRTRKAIALFPDLSNFKLSCNIHLDLKMAALVEVLLSR